MSSSSSSSAHGRQPATPSPESHQAQESDFQEEEKKTRAFGKFINSLTGGNRQDYSDKDENSEIRSQKKPSQGKLNIDEPAATAIEEYDEELDIPAFLRRQAN